jgi:deoxyribodipyrimidine photolyase-related protein
MPVTDTSYPQESVWILGDQLSTRHPGLIPGRRVVFDRIIGPSQSASLPSAKAGVLIVSAMRHFAAELRAAGYEVDIRSAADFLQGLARSRCPIRCTPFGLYGGSRIQHPSISAESGCRIGYCRDDPPQYALPVERYPPSRSPAFMEPFYRAMRSANWFTD